MLQGSKSNFSWLKAISAGCVICFAACVGKNATVPATTTLAQVNDDARVPASVDYDFAGKLLTADQFLKLTGEDKYIYLKGVQALLYTIEVQQSSSESRDSVSLLDFLVPPANALLTGACSIAGYPSEYRTVGRNSCQRPTGESTTCGNPPDRNITCNPFVYGVTDNGAPHCVSLSSNVSQVCYQKFTAKYGKNQTLLENDFAALRNDPKAKARWDGYVAKFRALTDEFKAGRQLPIDQKNALAYAQLALSYTKSRLLSPNSEAPAPAKPSQAFNLFALSDSEATSGISPRGSQAQESTSAKSQSNAAQSPARGSPRGNQDAPLYGLNCVQEGMKDAGLGDVSTRWLALVGTAIQTSGNHSSGVNAWGQPLDPKYRNLNDGPFDTSDPVRLAEFRKRVIQVIQTYGYCDSKVYPNLGEDPVERTKTQSGDAVSRAIPALLSGRNKNGARLERYIDQQLEEAGYPQDQATFSQLFGMSDIKETTKWNRSGETTIRHQNLYRLFPVKGEHWKNWLEQSSSDRQTRLTDPESNYKLETEKMSKPLQACLENIKSRTKERGGVFNLRSLGKPQPEFEVQAGMQTVAASARDYKKVRTQVRTSNQALCSRISQSCGLSDTSFCAEAVAEPAEEGPKSRSHKISK